jgi:DNA-binding HxlR family transcriptional regulator
VGYDQHCPRYERAMETLGKKWNGLILRILLGGPRRFTEIRALVPDLSDRVLSERLGELEAEGIIVRNVRATKPVAIEYSLTEKGRALEPVVEAIQAWAEAWCDVDPPAGGVDKP